MNESRMLKIELPKTVNTREVTPGRLYNVKVKDYGHETKYGVSRILQTRLNNPCIAILFNDGTVGYNDISEIIWLNQVIQ